MLAVCNSDTHSVVSVVQRPVSSVGQHKLCPMHKHDCHVVFFFQNVLGNDVLLSAVMCFDG